jgi:hypothetical protein
MAQELLQQLQKEEKDNELCDVIEHSALLAKREADEKKAAADRIATYSQFMIPFVEKHVGERVRQHPTRRQCSFSDLELVNSMRAAMTIEAQLELLFSVTRDKRNHQLEITLALSMVKKHFIKEGWIAFEAGDGITLKLPK